MKINLKVVFIFLSIASFISCSTSKRSNFKTTEVYNSKHLIINQIAENSFQHISFLKTNDFGNVPCNGLLVRNEGEAIIFDTPTNDTSSIELIRWTKENLKCKVKAIIPGHFHNDCLGGLKAFHNEQIPSYANEKSIELAKRDKVEVPQNGFKDSLSLYMGRQQVIVKFFGEGHTVDNVVGYFPLDNVLFGGCLLKELKASKGFLGDANVKAWSSTVEKVKKAYPKVKKVVPGHGQCGDKKLLDYTIKLFKTYQFGEAVFK